MKAPKAVAAGIGATITAISAAWAGVEVLVSDGTVGFDEVGSIAATLISLVGTIWGVWRAPYVTTPQPDADWPKR